MTLQEAYRSLNLVRDEFQAARFSLAQTLRALDADPAVHHASKEQQVTMGNLQSCAANLEITYTIRLFAEFEGVLRHYWLHARQRTTEPPMKDLMDGLAANLHMQIDEAKQAHDVRDYRNELIHEHLQDPRFDFTECLSRLARFLRWLPQRW